MTKSIRVHSALQQHQSNLALCRLCPDMQGSPVYGYPNVSSVMLIGQAPGFKEIQVNRPFAWTAGKTLFKWLDSTGLDEAAVRQRVYMAAVCRCFPGKNPQGGDRVPSPLEISQCRNWLNHELQLLRPTLIIPVGKLAIAQFMPIKKLNEVIGGCYRVGLDDAHSFDSDVIPLPHPSGASTWHRSEPGKYLLQQALDKLKTHPSWRSLQTEASRASD